MSRKLATKRRRALDPVFTGLELRFIDEFLITPGSATAAMKRAGSTTKYPEQQASEYLKKPHIAREIQRRFALQSEKHAVDKTWLITELVLQYNAAKAAAAITQSTSERRLAVTCLEKIGMHVDVNAFRQQIGLSNPDGSNLNLSGLSDADLDSLETLLAKAAIAGGYSSGEEPSTH